MPVDWKSAENNERLLACLFASIDESSAKINYRRIAELFGHGTTPNAIECNFRKIRAASKEVRKEWEEKSNGGTTTTTTTTTPTATPRKPKTPKKDGLSGVKSGRVEKPSTPSKKQPSAAVKTEEMPTPPAEMSYPIMGSFDSVFHSQSGMSFGTAFDDEI